MKHIELAQEIATWYPAIYMWLHARWQKDEQRPPPETVALLSHLEFTGPLTVSEAARDFQNAQSAMKAHRAAGLAPARG